MKIKLLTKAEDAPKKLKPGPKPKLMGKRMNFLPGDELRKRMDDLIEKARKLKVGKIKYAYILREGAVKEVRYIDDLLTKVKQGKLNGKHRDVFPEEEMMK